ncbi:hypothetical protein DXC97_22485 [Lachnospiraceae bacterium TF09-5]|nr:hypothetical protein DXC97_22485 [Lachnospiraceae bacterium TF09-5]
MLKIVDLWIKRVLSFIIGNILLYLCLLSVFSTSAGEKRDFSSVAGKEDISFYNFYLPDNIIKHLIILLLFIFIIYFLSSSLKRIGKNLNRYSWLNCLLYFLVGMVWILITRMPPISDQQKILNIAEQMVMGVYTQFQTNSGYLWRYPDQMGIVYYYYLITLIFGKYNYLVIQICNLIVATIGLVFVKKLADVFWSKECTCIGFGIQLSYMLFIPYLLYITFIYGTTLGFVFSLLAIYMEVLYLKQRKIKTAILSALFIGLAVVFKTNSMIMLIAMMLFLFYDLLIEHKEYKKTILFFVMIISVQIFFTQSIHFIMSSKSGYEVSKGMPKLDWVAMALQESRYAPGTWNGYSVHLYEEANYAYKDANQLALESIKKSLYSFWDDKSEAVRWLGRKQAAQWNEPCFGAIEISRNRIAAANMPKFAKRVIYGRWGYYIIIYQNYLQTLILFGCLMYFIFTKSKNIKRETLILGVVMLGGFLFHIFWEAKNQYVLPYFWIIIPYSVKGYQLVSLKIRLCIKK